MRKLVLLLVIITLCAMVLTACNPDPTESQKPDSTETTTEKTTDQPVTRESTGRDYETPIG